MAIVLEEKQSRVSLGNILGWFIVLAVIAVAAYYVFIKDPGSVEITLPGFENTEQISQIDLNAGLIVGNPEFQRRNVRISLPSIGSVGKSNPFLGF